MACVDCTAGMLMHECTQLWHDGPKQYVTDWWNWMDSSLIFLYLCYYSLQFVVYFKVSVSSTSRSVCRLLQGQFLSTSRSVCRLLQDQFVVQFKVSLSSALRSVCRLLQGQFVVFFKVSLSSTSRSVFRLFQGNIVINFKVSLSSTSRSVICLLQGQFVV